MSQKILSADNANKLPATGSKQDLWISVLPHEVTVGDEICVASDSVDDLNPRRPLPYGSRGFVKNIDADGDFELQLDDAKPYWIFRERLSVLRRRTCIDTILHEFNELKHDYVKWKLQAIAE